MKTLKKLKLNNLVAETLENRNMNTLRGGVDCGCSCRYEGQGGSSVSDNSNANHAGGYTPGPTCYKECWGSGLGGAIDVLDNNGSSRG